MRMIITVFAHCKPAGILLSLGSLVVALTTGTVRAQAGTLANDTIPATAVRRTEPYTGMTLGGKALIRIVADRLVPEGDLELSVVRIDAGSPAATAGLLLGDVILEVDGVAISSPQRPLAALATGVTYVLRIRRGQEEREVSLVPGPPRPVALPPGLSRSSGPR
jgi:S1-C subfamily serine protease